MRRGPARTCRPRRPQPARPGRPARPSAGRCQGRSPPGRRALARPSACRSHARAPLANGLRSTAACSIPGSWMSAVYRASPRARWSPSRRGAGRPTVSSGACGPLLERVLVDDDPLLGVAAFDLLLGLDQPCHDAIASSIFGIGAAAAEVSRHRVPDLLRRRRGVGGDERRRRDDLAGSAEAALERVCPDERVHHRMVAEPLDRRHLTVDPVDERDAGEDGDAVDLNGAGAAVALVAGDLGAGHADVLAQPLRERAADRRIELVRPAVHAQLRHPASPR